ncbi:putative aminotransferase [Aspergillus heteromorphus CBS 117.55]|uniref:Putative aminotransferase n=1 Tax=Aspergillus heteromorphus CBS 117.55 TaxID=1448321 RepID=A0A317VK51_9EURO|nr:putative aminotransferase [Aspergillus heteromorphus CBS 117.55]PWY74325.1 putative aminotransferase [Aspergillus heteromorphus CBS 117.55]
MPHIKDFAVERWMDLHENNAIHNLAETCCAAISLSDLVSFSETESQPETQTSSTLVNLTRKQSYGAIRGSDTLRTNIANRYSDPDPTISISGENAPPVPITKDNILVTSGGIQANFLALYTIIKPGDHVIVQYPTYQQLYSVPESLGAEVSLWRAQEERGWEVDVEELRGLVRPTTRVVVLNNPQNPTGAFLPLSTLQSIISLARTHDLTILSDEVYRPLFHSTSPCPPSILSLGYTKTISTGSMSKSYSLAGIRLGWLASPSTAILDACASVRDYTTISVSQIDDGIASVALSPSTVKNLLQRNMDLAEANLRLMDEFVDGCGGLVEWVRPTAGTTALLRFRDKMARVLDDKGFCERVLQEVGVLVVPARECFGRGWIWGVDIDSL